MTEIEEAAKFGGVAFWHVECGNDLAYRHRHRYCSEREVAFALAEQWALISGMPARFTEVSTRSSDPSAIVNAINGLEHALIHGETFEVPVPEATK